jgi:hypothetical protein
MPARAALFLLALLLVIPGLVSSAVIDSFVDGAFSLQATGGSDPFDQIVQSGLSTLGGGRTASLTVNSGTGTATLDLDPQLPLGLVTFASESPSTATLRYFVAAPGVDVTDGGSATEFAIAVVSLSDPVNVLLRVDDDFGGVVVIPASPVTSTGTITWSFSQFASIDLTRVRFIDLNVISGSGTQSSQYREFRTRGTGQPPGDLELRDAELVAGGSPVLQNGAGTVRIEDARLGRLGPAVFVPEPGALWQLGSGVGLLALLAGRHRRGKAYDTGRARAPCPADPALLRRRMP